MAETVTIDRVFHGPPDSGNGGYTCGILAQHVDGSPVEITLVKPIPLDQQLDIRTEAETTALYLNDTLIAKARPAELELDVPAAPDFATAARAGRQYIGLHEKLAFSTCFVCGTDRDEIEGLHIYAGRVGDSNHFAAAWRPSVHLSDDNNNLIYPEFIWAALDCPGAYAIMGDKKMKLVLGRLTGEVQQIPRFDEPCVILAWPLESNGRKHFCGTALFGASGECYARAKAVWFEI